MQKIISKFNCLHGIFPLIFSLWIFLLISPQMLMAQKKKDEGLEEKSFWKGTYECEGKDHPLLIKLKHISHRFKASFHALYDSSIPIQFEMTGIGENLGDFYQVELKPKAWIGLESDEFDMVPLKGKLSLNEFKGKMEHDVCGQFMLKRLDCINQFDLCTASKVGPLYQFLSEDLKEIQQKELIMIQATEFQKLIKDLSDSTSDKHRITVFNQELYQSKSFNMKQVVKIIDEFMFEDYKLALLDKLKGRVIDIENIALLLDEFAFEKSRNIVKAKFESSH